MCYCPFNVSWMPITLPLSAWLAAPWHILTPPLAQPGAGAASWAGLGYFGCYLTSPAGLLQKQERINNHNPHKHPHFSSAAAAAGRGWAQAWARAAVAAARGEMGSVPGSSRAFLRDLGSSHQLLLCQIKNPFALPKLTGLGVGTAFLALLEVSGWARLWPCAGANRVLCLTWGPAFASLYPKGLG